MKKLEAGILRGDVVKGGKRIDGRSTTDIRQIISETGLCQERMVLPYSRAVKLKRS